MTYVHKNKQTRSNREGIEEILTNSSSSIVPYDILSTHTQTDNKYNNQHIDQFNPKEDSICIAFPFGLAMSAITFSIPGVHPYFSILSGICSMLAISYILNKYS